MDINLIPHYTAQDFVDLLQNTECTCLRCGKSYYEIDNLGAWRCIQPAITNARVHNMGRMNDRAYRTPIYVKADHLSSHNQNNGAEDFYTAFDDVRISEQMFRIIRLNGVLHKKSIIPSGNIAQETPFDAPIRDASIDNALIGLRRYDWNAALAVRAEENLVFGDDFQSHSKGLLTKPLNSAILGRGVVVYLKNPVNDILTDQLLTQLEIADKIKYGNTADKISVGI